MKLKLPIAAALLATAVPAHAAKVVDVSNLVYGQMSVALNSTSWTPPGTPGDIERYSTFGQSWTPTRTGFLSQIDVYSTGYWDDRGKPPRLTVNIFSGDYTDERDVKSGGRRLLGTRVFTTDHIEGVDVYSFDMSGLEIATVAGQQLTFEFAIERCQLQGCLQQFVAPFKFHDGTTASVYKRGFAVGTYIDHGGDRRVEAFTDIDMSFRTFIEVPKGAIVPEPGTWALLIAGFGVIGSTMRRRRTGPAAFGGQQSIA